MKKKVIAEIDRRKYILLRRMEVLKDVVNTYYKALKSLNFCTVTSLEEEIKTHMERCHKDIKLINIMEREDRVVDTHL